MLIHRVTEAFKKAKVEYAIAGGWAVALHGAVPKDVIQFREEYIRNKKMLAWSFMNPTDYTEIVDILIVEDLRRLKTKVVKIGSQSIPLIALPDLIKMKKASGRPQDLEDIKALETLKK